MNLWNVKNLESPPVSTYKATDKSIDIKHLYNVFQEGIQFFSRDKYMNSEHAVLSTIIYRMKQKFRSAKDFKSLEKLNKALNVYFTMGILSDLENFIHLIPSRYSDETYLPTKNLLDYILVRLQGVVKLMERIVETSKISAFLLDKRIHTGHFWKIAFICFSLVSRTYVLAKSSAKFVCEFYNKLLPFSKALGNSSKNFLPKKYTLPKDLKEWLNVDWLEFDDDVLIVEPLQIPDIIQFFDLVEDDDDIEFYDEYVMVNDDDDDDDDHHKRIAKNKTGSPVNNMFVGELKGFDLNEDVGEIIEINDSVIIPNEPEDSLKNLNESIIEINDSTVQENLLSDASIIESTLSSSTDTSLLISEEKSGNLENHESSVVIVSETSDLDNNLQKRKLKNVTQSYVLDLSTNHKNNSIIDISDNSVNFENDSSSTSDEVISISDTSFSSEVRLNRKKKLNIKDKTQIKHKQNSVSKIQKNTKVTDSQLNFKENFVSKNKKDKNLTKRAKMKEAEAKDLKTKFKEQNKRNKLSVKAAKRKEKIKLRKLQNKLKTDSSYKSKSDLSTFQTSSKSNNAVAVSSFNNQPQKKRKFKNSDSSYKNKSDLGTFQTTSKSNNALVVSSFNNQPQKKRKLENSDENVSRKKIKTNAGNKIKVIQKKQLTKKKNFDKSLTQTISKVKELISKDIFANKAEDSVLSRKQLNLNKTKTSKSAKRKRKMLKNFQEDKNKDKLNQSKNKQNTKFHKKQNVIRSSPKKKKNRKKHKKA